MSLGVRLTSPVPTGKAAAWAVGRVRRLEEAGVDLVVFAQLGPGSLQPHLVAARAAPVTHSIGLVAEVPAAGAEPLHLSTALATLDIVSHGRAGWAVIADPEGTDGADADAVVDAVARLWDSWDDDAVIRDVETGRFLDRSRLHPLDLENGLFSIAGPSITPRPPQGRPVVFASPGVFDSSVTSLAGGFVDLPVPRSVDLEEAVELAQTEHVIVEMSDTVLDASLPRLHRALPAAPATLRERLGLERPVSVFATE